jgi:polyphenol oxidase
VREVEEVRAGGEVPLWVHPEWSDELPWLHQGTTGSGEDGAFDLGLAGAAPVGPALDRWLALRDALGCRVVVVSRQVHGVRIAEHRREVDGLLLMRGADGHLSGVPGVVMAVTVADCVPVTLVDPRRRRVALLHAGWRGTAAGIVEAGLAALLEGGAAGGARAHLGPAICGRCYEVGPEVHAAVHPDRPPPASPRPIDLRGAQAGRLRRLGVAAEAVTSSSWCTLCGGSSFHSHRAGQAARQAGIAGVRDLA